MQLFLAVLQNCPLIQKCMPINIVLWSHIEWPVDLIIIKIHHVILKAPCTKVSWKNINFNFQNVFQLTLGSLPYKYNKVWTFLSSELKLFDLSSLSIQLFPSEYGIEVEFSGLWFSTLLSCHYIHKRLRFGIIKGCSLCRCLC